MHHIAVQCRRRTVLGEQRNLPALSAVLVESSMLRHQAALWASLISPKNSTWRCTFQLPDTRRFSTMLQERCSLPSFGRILCRRNMTAAFQSYRPFCKRFGRHRKRFSAVVAT
jgi:hypothetical protein